MVLSTLSSASLVILFGSACTLSIFRIRQEKLDVFFRIITPFFCLLLAPVYCPIYIPYLLYNLWYRYLLFEARTRLAFEYSV